MDSVGTVVHPAASEEQIRQPAAPVRVVFSLTSTQEMQAKIDAADLAARQAIYEKNLLAHQLEADSRERMRLQAGLKELAMQHKRVVRAAMAAEMEASGLRQQAADAATAASTAQAQAVQAVQAAQQQLALLQAQQQQLLQSQQSMLGAHGALQRGSMGALAAPYTGADGKLVMPQVPFSKGSLSSDQGSPPFMLGTLGGAAAGPHQSKHQSGSHADLTEGLFDDLDVLDGPHGSFRSQAGGAAPNLFSPELCTYPYGPGYNSKKRLSTSSAPTVAAPPPGKRDQHKPPMPAASSAGAGARQVVDLASVKQVDVANAQDTTAAAAAEAARVATQAVTAAKGAAATAAGAAAEEPQSVRMDPATAAHVAAQAAQGTMVQASDRLVAGAVPVGGRATPSATDTTTDHGDVSTTQLADHAPSVVASTEVEGITPTATDNETEDTFSTTTVYPEGGKRPSMDKHAREGVSQPSTPPPNAIEEAPELEAAAQPLDLHAEGASLAAPLMAPSPRVWHPLSSSSQSHKQEPATPGRTSMDIALSEVQSAMGHMYRTQSDDPLSHVGPSSLSMHHLPLEPSYPSAPDLRGKEAYHPVHSAYLPLVGGGAASMGGGVTPALGGGSASEHLSSEPLPLREQLLRLSTCNVPMGDPTTRPTMYGGSPTSSTGANALVGSPGAMWAASASAQAPLGPLPKAGSDGQTLSASQLLAPSALVAPATQPMGAAAAQGARQVSQPSGLAIEMQTAGSLAQGIVGVAGEGGSPHVGGPALLTTSSARRTSESPFLNCRSFALQDASAADLDFTSPVRSGTLSPNTPFSPRGSMTQAGSLPRLPAQGQAAGGQLHTTQSLQTGAGYMPTSSLVGLPNMYQEQPIHGLPPGPALVRRRTRPSLTGVRMPDTSSASVTGTTRRPRSGSVSPGAYGSISPGAYGSYAGGVGSVGMSDSGGLSGRPLQPGSSFKTWAANRPATRSGLATPLSTSVLSLSRGRSGMVTPGLGTSGHPLVAAHQASQSKLDEDLHLLQALDKITNERRNEIVAEMEHMQHEDDGLSSVGGYTSIEHGPSQVYEAARVKKLQEELNRAKAEASRAEAERAEAVRARHEVAVHFQSVLAQQQKRLPGSEKKEQSDNEDVCAVIADDAMRQRCRDLLTDILGNTGEEQQVPPAYVVAPAAPVAPIHAQQQVNNMQSMLTQMEKVVGRLNQSLEREEAARQEKEAMNKRLQALESLVLQQK